MSNPKDLVGAKKAPLRYVPAAVVIEASGPMEDGANKYGPFNWREKPVEMVTYLEAIERHLMALKDGQDNAEDSGYSHIGHIIAGAGIIADAKANGTLIDNRYSKGPAADMLRARDRSTIAPVPQAVEPAGPVEHRCEDVMFLCSHITSEAWGAGDGNVYGVDGEHWRLYGHLAVVPDTRVSGRLTCCGQTEHSLDCPQYR